MGSRPAQVDGEIEESPSSSNICTSSSKRPHMIDEVLERAVPWGVFIGIGALIGAAFPRETRSAAKTLMLNGFRAADWARAFSAEAYEKGQDVFAEARLEYDQLRREAEREAERGRLHVVSSSRRRVSRSNGHRTARPHRQGQPSSKSI